MPRHYSRRSFLRAAAVGGSGLLAAQLIGCNGGEGPSARATPSPGATAPAGGTPTVTTGAALTWRQLQPAGESPPARHDHSLISDGQRLYLFGGRSTGALDDLWSYDLAAATWAPVAAGGGPAARFGHNAAWDAARGRMVVFGGQGASGFFNDLWAFDPAGGGWSPLSASGEPPSSRYGAASAYDQAGRLLVSHGFTDAGRFDDSWSLALAGDAWSDVSPGGTRPVERCLMRAAWDPTAGQLLMFGGQTTGTPFLGDLWSLSDAGWREITADPRPSPRNFYAMALDEQRRRLMLLGGNTTDGPVNDLWFFDPAIEAWSEAVIEGEVPSPRSGHDGAWLADSRRFIVFGGRTADGDASDLWELTVPA